jgi:hypothetical protein
MEVAWEDRGKIAHENFYPEANYEWDCLPMSVKAWLNKVFDACINTETLYTPNTDSPDAPMKRTVVLKKDTIHG